MTQKTLLSIGHGYSSERIAAALPPGRRVIATSRDPARVEVLRAGGIEALVWDPAAGPAGIATALAEASHIVSSVGPVGGIDPVSAVLAASAAPRLEWLGYLSASSVYGDAGGAWVDESCPALPDSPRGRERLAAEDAWAAWAAARGLGGIARFRIAGIYGPGRSPFEALASGRAQRIVKPGHHFNRIHVEDLGRIVAAAAVQGATGAFILADGTPAAQPEPVEFAAALLGIEPPPLLDFETAPLSPMARSFYGEHKRLRSLRLGELGLALRYPDFRAGLTAIHSAAEPR